MATLTVSPENEKRVKALGFLSNKGTDNFNGRVITVNGKVTSAQLAAVADAAKTYGNGDISLTTRLTLEVNGIPYESIDQFRDALSKAGLTTGGTGSKVRPVVSCKGTTCQYGLIDTYKLAEELHHRFYEGYGSVKLPHKFKLAVGGCPNNCVKPDLNDLGIIGQRIPLLEEDDCNGCKKCAVEAGCPMKAVKMEDGLPVIDKELCNNCGRCITMCRFHAMGAEKTGYKIFIGGRWGKKTVVGRPLNHFFATEEEVFATVEKAILLFREQGKTGERFAKTIERLGFENVEKILLSDDILARKEQILSAELHVSGGATC